MALATGNRSKIRYILEQVFGEVPGSGTPKDLRFTKESLKYTIGTTPSSEVRSDRMTSDLVQTSASTQGGLNFELSYKEFDKFFESALQNTWLGMNDTAIPSVTVTTQNTITAAAGTPFAGVVVGQVVQFSGFATAANNVELTVATATSTILTFAGTPLTNEAAVAVNFSSKGKVTLSVTTTLGTTLTAASGAPFANVVAGQRLLVKGMPTASNNKVITVVSKTNSQTIVCAPGTFANEAGPTTTLSSSRLKNGTTERSWSIERALTDVNQFFVYRGMSLSKMSLDFPSAALVTGSFDFMGKDSVRTTVTSMPGVSAPSQTYDIMNTVTGVGSVAENGAALTGTFVKSLKLDVDNKLRARDALGTLGAVSVGSGTLMATGSMSVYLSDGVLYDKFVNNTASSVSWSVQDADGNGYAFQLPKVKYSDVSITEGGLDTDVMLEMSFTALADTATNAEVVIDRFGA